MDTLDHLSQTSTNLANHVAEVVRISNAFDDILKDAVRGDISPMTKTALFAQLKAMHDGFRAEHFRQLIATLNETIADIETLWNEAPASTGQGNPETPGEEPGIPEPGTEDAGNQGQGSGTCGNP